MAFNFNWSPLMADPSFYTRAREMLTSSLNKSPKPPIIVDDILVNELNLGSVPPDLEILEIGDLAQDKFRGIFKMCYSGDAYLTLKTRVQANPLNTYLASRPSFASPEPLAAHSGLTIPLQITLSEIKLSAFIILVFSKQKGLTLVFRNDPLESLKVSSTFDSIPFVRDYLQKTIEQQLRSLLMDELPAIIHRLSLRLWVPEFHTTSEQEEGTTGEIRTDPLASPPQDPVDSTGHALDANEIASLSLDSSIESQSLFSHRNVLRLAALSDSQRTLSLFTPHMQEVVYRVWAGSVEKAEHNAGVMPPWPMSSRSSSPLLSRHQSLVSLSRKQSVSSDSAVLQQSTQTIRPALAPHSISYMSAASTTKAGKPRRKKHRIINLRRKATDGFDDNSSIFSGSSYTPTLSSSATTSDYAASEPLPQIREGEMITPPVSPEKKRQGLQPDAGIEETPRRSETNRSSRYSRDISKALQYSPEPTSPLAYDETIKPSRFRERTNETSKLYALAEKQPQPAAAPVLSAPFPYAESSPGGVLEQAWMMKMANEIARRVQVQNETAGSASRRGASTLGSSKHCMGLEHQSARDDALPPAYAL